MTRRPRLRLLALATAVALVAAACTGGEDELIIYSGRGQSLVGPLLEQFSEETDTPIAVRYGQSADLALLISEEGEDTPADVYYAQNPGAVQFLSERDLLGELSDDLLERVDERFRGPDWVGVTGRLRVLVYNEELVDEQELPDSVFDLTAGRFDGRVAVAPRNGSFQDFVTAMRVKFGRERTLEWLRGIARNDAPTYPNNNAIVDAVSRGEVPMGLVNHYYNFRFHEEDPDLPSRNHIFPDGDIGALLITASASVLASSDDPRAEEFIRFLLTEDAQRYFREETFEYPLAAGVEPVEGLPDLSALELPRVDIENLGSLGTTTDLIAQSGLSD